MAAMAQQLWTDEGYDDRSLLPLRIMLADENVGDGDESARLEEFGVVDI